MAILAASCAPGPTPPPASATATISAGPTGSSTPPSAFASGAASVGPAPSVGPVPTGTVPAPTDPTLVPAASVGGVCSAIRFPDHVSGRLEADPADAAWPVRVRTLTGRELFVRWPAGFRVRFTPTLALLDETGRVVSTGSVDLPQVDLLGAPGTPDHPYVATGVVFGRCYIRRP